MRVGQRRWSAESGWIAASEAQPERPQVVLVFGAREVLEVPGFFDAVRASAPSARVLACSTAGEILGTAVREDTATATAIEFASSSVEAAAVSLDDHRSSFDAGAALADRLRAASNLRHVFVVSDGLRINGSDLVRGMTQRLPDGVGITGGLSADGTRFERTLVGLDEAPREGRIAVLGLCGPHLSVGCGSMGGWGAFGPERMVTRSTGNVLYELDGRPALELYTSYLGKHAADLPASGLLFPLSLRVGDDSDRVVRTILAVDHQKGTMTFAGDVPEGSSVRLMKAGGDRLIDGAMGAARRTMEGASEGHGARPDLAILISCVGRKLVLKQRVEEEIEAVREALGDRPTITGFYSYGEIAPFRNPARCELHNQTMTITTIGEG